MPQTAARPRAKQLWRAVVFPDLTDPAAPAAAIMWQRLCLCATAIHAIGQH